MNSLENKAIKIAMSEMQDIVSDLDRLKYQIQDSEKYGIDIKKTIESCNKRCDEIHNKLNGLNNWLHALKENKTT